MKAKWITPVVTALDQKGHIDIEANKRIYDFLIDGGMDGILLFGSIGEFFALSLEDTFVIESHFMWEPVIWNLRPVWNCLIMP